MKFSVLCSFKSTSRIPQITQILVLTFKIVGGGGGGIGGGGGVPPDPLRNPGSDSESLKLIRLKGSNVKANTVML